MYVVIHTTGILGSILYVEYVVLTFVLLLKLKQ